MTANSPPPRNTARILLILSVVLYLLACVLPAIELQKKSASPDTPIGGALLLIGWLGIFNGLVAWYANPMWLLSTLLVAFRRGIAPARIFAVLALLLGLSTFLFVHAELPGDEGGVSKMAFERVLAGGYLWLLSLAATTAAAFTAQEKRK